MGLVVVVGVVGVEVAIVEEVEAASAQGRELWTSKTPLWQRTEEPANIIGPRLGLATIKCRRILLLNCFFTIPGEVPYITYVTVRRAPRKAGVLRSRSPGTPEP